MSDALTEEDLRALRESAESLRYDGQDMPSRQTVSALVRRLVDEVDYRGRQIEELWDLLRNEKAAWEREKQTKERLRSVLSEAVTELDAEHRQDDDARSCVVCAAADGSWPCVTALVARDLRKALS